MHTETGRLYDLPAEIEGELGEDVREKLQKYIEESDIKLQPIKDELREAAISTAPIVGVSGDVAQRLRLGDRELQRRRQRRR